MFCAPGSKHNTASPGQTSTLFGPIRNTGSVLVESMTHLPLPEGVHVLRWPHPHPLPEEEVLSFFRARDLDPSHWSNEPEAVYGAHSHPYRKILFCVQGSITFSFPGDGQQVELKQGDRLILLPDVAHGAVVGHGGVVCIEAAEQSGRE